MPKTAEHFKQEISDAKRLTFDNYRFDEHPCPCVWSVWAHYCYGMHNCLFVAKPADLPRLLLRNAFEAFASFETLFPPLSAHLLASSNLC